MTSLANLYKNHLEVLQTGYSQALRQAGFDTIVIESGQERLKHPRDDQHFPFWPEPMFLHWLPLREPGTHLVFTAGKKPELVRARHDSFWEGPAPLPDDYVFSGFDVKELPADKVKAALPQSGRVVFIGAEGSPPAGLIEALSLLRSKKTDYERHCIGEANRRAARAHTATFAAFQDNDLSELELYSRYLAALDEDADGTPYKSIIALNTNAAILHHIHYGRERSHEVASLLIDAGGMFAGYCSDITRTQVKGASEAAKRFGQLIQLMDAMQQEVIRRIRVGMNYEELHDESHVLLARVLLEVGICRGSEGELTETGVTRTFFPHGLGHSLGIQVHDVGCKPRAPAPKNPFLRHTATIAAGQVFTIEPGCYFIPSLLEELRGQPAGRLVDWKVVDLLTPLGGIRIEDDVGVLDNGTVNLTRQNWA